MIKFLCTMKQMKFKIQWHLCHFGSDVIHPMRRLSFHFKNVVLSVFLDRRGRRAIEKSSYVNFYLNGNCTLLQGAVSCKQMLADRKILHRVLARMRDEGRQGSAVNFKKETDIHRTATRETKARRLERNAAI